MDTFTARTPVDLLALVPIVIGFHPEDSVVVLTFGEPRRTAGPPQGSFQARMDLPVNEHEQRAVAATIRRVLDQNAVTTAALVVYSDDAGAALGFADLLVPDLLDDGVTVVDVLRADGERYYSVADPGDPGTPYDLDVHPMTAAGVLQGRVVHENRQALADTLIGTDEEDRIAVADAADQFVAGLLDAGRHADLLTDVFAAEARWVLDTLARLCAERVHPSAAVAGRLLVLLSFDSVREVAWSPLRRSNADAHADVLRSLVRRAPEELLPGAAGLLALAAWLAGHGALSWCALERCLAADPDDTVAQHVAALLEGAVPPTVWSPVPVDTLPLLAGRER